MKVNLYLDIPNNIDEATISKWNLVAWTCPSDPMEGNTRYKITVDIPVKEVVPIESTIEVQDEN